jgi:hypothetical protein
MVTVALVCVSAEVAVLDIVAMLATVWGLDLALVIYLITARDTDKLLARIDILQDQLSAALEAPGPDSEVVDPAEESTADELGGSRRTEDLTPTSGLTGSGSAARIGTTPNGMPTDSEPAAQTGPVVCADAHTGQSPNTAGSRRADVVASAVLTPAENVVESPPVTIDQRRDPRRWPNPNSPTRLGPPPQWFATRIPPEHLAALNSQAGVGTDQILRAWTPHPRGNGPWVIETRDGQRWSVFQRGNRPVTVVSLDDLRADLSGIRRGRAQRGRLTRPTPPEQ